MLEIKLARSKDLDNIVKLYVEDFNNKKFDKHDYTVEPITNEQARHRWEKHLDKNPILVAYNDDEFLGFCVLSDAFEYLNIDNFYVKASRFSSRIYTEFIFEAGKVALNSGYFNMSIFVDGNDNFLRELCIELGARSDFICGMMYTYYEKLVWDDLKRFIEED